MPPILVPPSTKRIAIQKVYWSTRIRCENCSRLRMKTLEQCQWRHPSVFIVHCQHILNFVLIADVEQANVCWVHIGKTNTFEDKIGYIMRYVVVLAMWTKFISKEHLKLNHHNATSESVRDFCEGVYFRGWLWLKRRGSNSKWPVANLYFYRFCSREDFTWHNWF